MQEKKLKWQMKLLRLFCRQEYLEEVEGDLLEQFEKRVSQNKPAKRMLWVDVIKLIRPRLLKPFVGRVFNENLMIRHYIKSSFRFVNANRTTSSINLIGLTVGMASAFLLFKYIGFFYTIDDFQEKKDRIYSIHQTLNYKDGPERHSESTYNGVAPLLKELYPEVEMMSRYITTAETLVRVDRPDGSSIRYNELSISEVDPDFIRMFSLKFLRGDPRRALDKPYTMALSASMAKKYFGDQDPLGKTVTTTKSWGEKRTWTITGVFEDYPNNSYFKFNALQSMIGKEFEVNQVDWSYPFFKSFVLLKNEDGSELGVEEKATEHANQLEAFQASGDRLKFHFVSLTERNLTDSQKLLIAVAVFLMLITWINYANLSATHSLTRGKEFGVRKVLGSSKISIAKQFVLEAGLIYFFAGVAALALVVLVHPALGKAINGQILDVFEFDTSINLLFILVLIVGSIASAIVPSITISGFSVMNLVKNKIGSQSSIGGFRKVLVSLQLIIALVMLTGMIAIYKQMEYVRTKDLGIDSKQTLILKGPKDEWEGKLQRLSSFKNEVQRLANVENLSSSTTVPFWWAGAPTIFKKPGDQEEYRMLLIGTDGQYFHGYDIEILAGKSYENAEYNRKKQLIVINETASKKLGFLDPTDALNSKIINTKTGSEFEIVGVAKDYHHQSFRTEIRPQVFNLNPFRGFVSIHLNLEENASAAGITTAIQGVEKVWNEVYSDQAFDYFFLDEQLDNLYTEERLFQRMFVWFTSVSIVVTFLGIFGLSMFISLQRRKEMSIRKVMGAQPFEILRLFYLEFARKVLIAFAIGMPVSYYLMNMWLSNFTYRFDYSIWIFIVPGLLISLFMVASLSYEGRKMIQADPAKILRDE